MAVLTSPGAAALALETLALAAVYARYSLTDREQPAGLCHPDWADGSTRGLRAVCAQPAGLMLTPASTQNENVKELDATAPDRDSGHGSNQSGVASSR
jgi:hypothetical protein